MAGFDRKQVSNNEEREGLTECEVSWQGVTEGLKVSQMAGSNIMRKGKVSQKARYHRWQGLTEGRVSQNAAPHRRKGLTEERALENILNKGRASKKAASHI